MKLLRLTVWTCLFALGLTGCARTYVVRHPGRFDHGIRYYRPKPYLVVKHAVGNDKDKTPIPGFVTVDIEYLPDFTEEYSVHINAGLGKNKTVLTLWNGWRLDDINIEADSKTDENIKATAALLSAVQKFTVTGNEPSAGAPMLVKGTNVPLGYYEAVVSIGPDKVKRLYGWRYVGFFPYSQCPIDTGGLEKLDCQTADMYTLVVERKDGKSYIAMRSLAEVATTTPRHAVTEELPPPRKERTAAEKDFDKRILSDQKLVKGVKDRLGDDGITEKHIRGHEGMDKTTFNVTIEVAKDVHMRLRNDMNPVVECQKLFKAEFKEQPSLSNRDFIIEIKPRQK